MPPISPESEWEAAESLSRLRLRGVHAGLPHGVPQALGAQLVALLSSSERRGWGWGGWVEMVGGGEGGGRGWGWGEEGGGERVGGRGWGGSCGDGVGGGTGGGMSGFSRVWGEAKRKKCHGFSELVFLCPWQTNARTA